MPTAPEHATLTDDDVVRALSALAQESRLRIFRLLVVAGPEGVTPGRITEQLAIAPTSLSFHLKELAQAGLVTQERIGRHLVYRARLDVMNTLLAFLTDNCCGGAPCDAAVADLSCKSC